MFGKNKEYVNVTFEVVGDEKEKKVVVKDFVKKQKKVLKTLGEITAYGVGGFVVGLGIVEVAKIINQSNGVEI